MEEAGGYATGIVDFSAKVQRKDILNQQEGTVVHIELRIIMLE
jgi:hypothetical protein